jgi:phage baseplate assembly protein W
MSYGAKNIYPIDSKPRVAVGVAIPFNQPGVFGSTYITKDAIKTNLVNYLLTNKTERYLQPTFGGDLRKYIFEQINSNTMDFLKEDIQSNINQNFPNVSIDAIDIEQYPDNNAIVVSLYYTIINTGINDNLQLQFN